jgi:hypothetical protein
MVVVKAAVAVAMVEVGLVLQDLKEGILRAKGRKMVGVEMGCRNVLAHSGFMLIKCIVTGPKV